MCHLTIDSSLLSQLKIQKLLEFLIFYYFHFSEHTFLISPRGGMSSAMYGWGGRGVFLSPSTSFLGKCPWRKVAIRRGSTHHTRGHHSSYYCSSAPKQPHIWLPTIHTGVFWIPIYALGIKVTLV